MMLIINPGSATVVAEGNGWTNTYEQACRNAEDWFKAMRADGFVDIEMLPTEEDRGGRWLFIFRHAVTGVSVELEMHGIDNLDAYVHQNIFYPRVYWNGWGQDPSLRDFAAKGFETVVVKTYRKEATP